MLPTLPGQPADVLAGIPKPLNTPTKAPCFAFLLVSNFSLVAFASAIEPLRMANMVGHEQHFAALTCSLDGMAVTASNGVCIAPDAALENLPVPTAVFVCGPNPIEFPDEPRLIQWLRHLAGRGSALGGIDTGSYLLARAGLLNGFRCTIHWQDLPSLTAAFPELIVSEQLYEIDRDRYTCSGGTAAMDMMLQLIAARVEDETVAPAATDLLLHERVRDARDRQRIPLRHRLGPGQDRLSGAVTLMEANVEEPMQLNEIAAYVGVSERQLERLFDARLGSTPREYYMTIRLARARRFVLHTSATLSDIAHRCGFGSIAHFSRRYRAQFGIAPRADRAGKV